jgi:hypothetical protein
MKTPKTMVACPWLLIIALSCPPAQAQKKAPAPDDKVEAALADALVYAADYEAYGKAEAIDLSKYEDTKQYVRQQKLAGGFCYRFILVSTPLSGAYRLEVAVDGTAASESAPGPWVFADACVDGADARKVKARISWTEKGGKAVFTVVRKPLKEAATKDDLLRNLLDAASPQMKKPAWAPVTGFVKAKGKLDIAVPAGVKGWQAVTIMPGKDLKKLSAQILEGKDVLDSATSEGAPVSLVKKKAPKKPETVSIRVKAEEGQGIFLLVFMGGTGGAEPIEVAGKSSTDLLAERIALFVKKLSPNLSPTGESKFVTVSGGQEETTVTLPVKGGVCYRMAAAWDPKITAIGFEVAWGKKGKISGKKYKDLVMADLCPEKAGKAKIKITAAGEGAVAFSTFAGSPDAIVYASGGSPLDLDKLLKKLDGAVEKYGTKMEPADTPVTGVAKYGETGQVAVKLDKDFCYTFIAVLSCEAGCGLELSPLEAGKPLAATVKGAGEAVLEFCPGKTVEATASLKLASTERGKEAWAFIPMRKKAKAKMKVYAAGEAKDDYLAKKIIEQAQGSCKGLSAVSPVLRATLKTNEAASLTVKLAGEVCYTIVAVGKPSVKDIKVTLINPIKQEIAADEGSGPTAVVKTGKCPQWDGDYTVKVKMFNGYGDVGVQVFGDVQ